MQEANRIDEARTAWHKAVELDKHGWAMQAKERFREVNRPSNNQSAN